MKKTILVPEGAFYNIPSRFSFSLLITYLKEKQRLQNGSINKDLQDVLEIILQIPELNAPINDPSIIVQHESLIRRLMHLMLPLYEINGNYYEMLTFFPTVSLPENPKSNNFSLTTFGEDFIIEEEHETILLQARLKKMYQLIIQNYYGVSFPEADTCTLPVLTKVSGRQKTMELELGAEFMELKLLGNLPLIGQSDLIQIGKALTNNIFPFKQIPVQLFELEGLFTIKMRDVTARESVKHLKNILIDIPYFNEPKSFKALQLHVQKILNLPEARLSLTSLKNDARQEDACISPGLQTVLLKPVNFLGSNDPLLLQITDVFRERSFLLLSSFEPCSLKQYPFLQSCADRGIKSLLVIPLRNGKDLMGILFIVSRKTGSITSQHVLKMEPVIPLFEIALGKQSEKMDDEVDRVIKEQFTAVQSSVNWKFNAAARNFITQKNNSQESKIESIVFENVFPLYGSIDVRNSSIERSTAMQKDLLEQLYLADAIIRKSKSEIYLYSLQELSYQIDKYINIASVLLFPGDELAIQNFLDDEVNELFNHLKTSVPSIRPDIDNYFSQLTANTRKISRQCSAFEQSIGMINNELVRFINQEQIKVQEIYAHYFEYFVTDGVDFNIYIGQSITPEKPFDHFYLKNLKLWQLATLVKAAQKVRRLQDSMPVSLDTTQLILAHSKPLSISFRPAERKFDVDGAYNINYEIIKKRIDKIKIQGTCERLTQPGKIAIVFAHHKEALEYTAYIEFLQKEGLLETPIEHFELEELPGVRGLKALRVAINMNIKEEEICPLLINDYQLLIAG